MVHPRYEKDKSIKMEAPRRRRVSHWPEETRFDLPFPHHNGQLLYFSKFWRENWYTPTQFHDHFELCYVGAGQGWFILEGMLFPVERGDIFVTKPGEIHCGGARANSGFAAYAVGFRFEQLGELENGFFRLGLHRICHDDAERLEALFERMLSELEAQEPYAHVIVQACLSTVLALILRDYGKQEGMAASTNHLTAVILDALSLIHSDTNYIGKVDELARRINFSRVHLDREFKEQIGVSPGEYIRGVWADRAKRLLRQTDDSVARIAELLQFDSPQAFGMFFKRQTGLSPQLFRKRTAAT